MKKRKVLEINTCGQHLKGYYEEGKINPWRLYKVEWKTRKCGCGMSESKVMIAKYANFISMMCLLKDYFSTSAEAWKD